MMASQLGMLESPVGEDGAVVVPLTDTTVEEQTRIAVKCILGSSRKS